jgi:hypothetical protein
LAEVTPATCAAAVKLLDSAARQNSSMLPSCKSSKWRFMIDYTEWRFEGLHHLFISPDHINTAAAAGRACFR